jgi:acetyl esterase/lipase
MPEPRTINLWPDGSPNNPANDRPRIEYYPPAKKPAAPVQAVIVCPGGGYGGRAAHEGRPVAELFAQNGMVGFVCHYRVAPNRYPAPMADAARAIRLVRSMAGEFGVDGHRVAIMGFSAGGHLACTTATQPDLHHDEQDDLVDKFPARPDRGIFCYPVVSMVTAYHHGSAANLLGPNPPEDQRKQMSNELHVTAKTPECFIFHTSDDGAVPVQNSLNYAAALTANKVPYAMHIYTHGRHGVGLALDMPALKSWSGLLVDWLKAWEA